MTKFRVTSFEQQDEAREYYLSQVDLRAEQCRARHLTPGAGQAMTYELKYQEALVGGGPLLHAEAEALGKAVEAVVESVLASRKRWEEVSAQIECERLKAKKVIRHATTPDEMYGAVRALDFPV